MVSQKHSCATSRRSGKIPMGFMNIHRYGWVIFSDEDKEVSENISALGGGFE